jgi:hypothetical protein
VGGVERGQRNIALKNICKLANALGMSPSALLIPPDIPGVPIIVPTDSVYRGNDSGPSHLSESLSQ